MSIESLGSGVYALFDAESGECLYVGISTEINRRYHQHINLLKRKKHLREDFIFWWIDHGENESSIEFKILENCPEELLNEREIFWFHNLNPKFYGKEPSENESWRHSEETKEKIKQSSRTLAKREIEERGGKYCEERRREVFTHACEYCKLKFDSPKPQQSFCSVSCSAKNSSLYDTSSLEEEIVLFYNEGMSCRAIARKLLGVNDHKKVTKILSRKGIEIKRRSGKNASEWKYES